MIRYNMRYRGPIEHDKFVLNILQLSNEVSGLVHERSSVTSLTELQSEVDTVFEDLTGNPDGSKIGLSESLYYKMLDYKE